MKFAPVLVALCLVLATALLSCSLVHAIDGGAPNGPKYSSQTPTAQSTISVLKPTISVVISGSGGMGSVDGNSIHMYVDSMEVLPDLSAAPKLVYVVPVELSEGQHIVKVESANLNGEVSYSQWSFYVSTKAPTQPANFVLTQSSSGNSLSWSPGSDVAQYKLYYSATPFTSVSGKTPLVTLDNATKYIHSTNGKAYYALVAVGGNNMSAQPVFVGSCSAYSNGGWNDYSCCSNNDCTGGKTCDSTSHTCVGGTTAPPPTTPVTTSPNTTQTTAPDASQASAQAAIDEAKALIRAAQDKGNETTKAEEYYITAQAALKSQNYAEALKFAQMAKANLSPAAAIPVATQSPITTSGKQKLPCCPMFVLLGVGILATYFANKKK